MPALPKPSDRRTRISGNSATPRMWVVIQFGPGWIKRLPAQKNGRPLQNLTPTTLGGFVAAVPSRAFRDGTGIFTGKTEHNLSTHRTGSIGCPTIACGLPGLLPSGPLEAIGDRKPARPGLPQ